MPSNPLLRAVGISQAVPKPLEEGSSQLRYISFVSKGKKKDRKSLGGSIAVWGCAAVCLRLKGECIVTHGAASPAGLGPGNATSLSTALGSPGWLATIALGTPPQRPRGNRLTQRVPGQGLRWEGEQALVTPSRLLQTRCCPSSR